MSFRSVTSSISKTPAGFTLAAGLAVGACSVDGFSRYDVRVTYDLPRFVLTPGSPTKSYNVSVCDADGPAPEEGFVVILEALVFPVGAGSQVALEFDAPEYPGQDDGPLSTVMATPLGSPVTQRGGAERDTVEWSELCDDGYVAQVRLEDDGAAEVYLYVTAIGVSTPGPGGEPVVKIDVLD